MYTPIRPDDRPRPSTNRDPEAAAPAPRPRQERSVPLVYGRRLVGINVTLLLPYLWLLACAVPGGRGSSCFGVGLLPVLLAHGCVTVLPAIRGKLIGAGAPLVWSTTFVSLLVGAAAAVLSIVNEHGC